MAENNYKTLQTRISLKHDSYTNWHKSPGKDLVLLPGEIGICTIENKTQGAQTAPTVLFKVGDGTHAFWELKWASALAADVYSWAKASAISIDETSKSIVLTAGNDDGTDLKLPINYITPEEVAEITDELAEDIADLKAALGIGQTGSDSVTARITAAEGRLDVLEGADTEEGSVAKAVKDATTAITAAYEEYADQAEADALAEAKKYADEEVLKDRNRIGALEEADAAQDLLIAANTKAIEDEAKARTEADKAINDKIGTVAEGSTVVGLINAVAQSVTDLANGDVADNAEAIGQNAEAIEANAEEISALKQALAKEVSDRESGDSGLDGRLKAVEAFFEAADHDGKEGGLKDALDTLVEIQDFLSGEGKEVDQMLDAIQENATDIAALESVVGGTDGNGGLVGDMNVAQEDISGLKSGVSALNDIVDGYTGKGSIQSAIEAAAALGQTGIDNAATADSKAVTADGKAVDAQNRVGVLEGIVGGKDAGLVADMAAAEEAITDHGQRLTAAESEIDALQAKVLEGDNTNDKLRADIAELQGIVKTGADANATLGGEIDTLAAEVHDGTTGLPATYTIATGAAAKADDNAEAISAIQSDYLKVADWFVIDCGTSELRTGEPVAPLN